MTHPFWGEVKQDWAGFSSDISFSHSFFDKQEVEVFLNDEYDDDYEEIEEPPNEQLLNEFADTYINFVDNIENRLTDLQQKAFDRYQKVYAHYYENPEKSNEEALNIDTVDKHNLYIKDIN